MGFGRYLDSGCQWPLFMLARCLALTSGLFLILSGPFQVEGAKKSSSGAAPVALLVTPESQNVTLGAIVYLECSSDTETQVDWFHNGNKIASWESDWEQTTTGGNIIGAGGLQGGSRHMLSFSARDEPRSTTGLYSCKVWNNVASASSKNATISISINANFIRVPEDKTILRGEVATLSCELKSNVQRGSTVLWYHNDQLINFSLDPRITFDQFGLQIRNSEPRDEGSYHCMAVKAGLGNFSSSKGSIKIVYPPRVDDNMDKEMIGFVSRSVLINCPMMGEPAISCYWSRVGQQEIPATRAMQTDNRLAIGHVQSSDEGEYLCSCSNKYGENRVIVQLKVPTILEFEKKPVDAVALVGHKIQIPCLVKSNSQQSQDVTIVWERTEGASVYMFQGDIVENKEVFKNGTLMIRNVTNSDRGYYTCKALQPTANAQQISQKIFLEVRVHSNLRPPIITIAPFNHSLRPGGSLRLPCAASSGSAVTITWRFENAAWGAAVGHSRGADQRISTDETGALTVSNVRYEDNGLYKCIASTETGTSERSAVIIVKKDGLEKSPDSSLLPRPVSKPIIITVTKTSVTLTWNPGVNFNPEYAIEMYSYEPHVFAWSTVGSGVASNSFTVNNLTPDQGYEFVVRGVNTLGAGLPSQVSSRVRTIADIKEPVETGLRDSDIKMEIEKVEVEALEGTPINSTAVWIQWNVIYNSHILQGFYIKYSQHDGGNSFHNIKYKTIRVDDKNARAVLVSNLHPWSSYMASIQPHYDKVAGLDSELIFFTTPEGVPRDIVSKVSLHKISSGRYIVRWEPLVRQREGNIIGYNVALFREDSPEPIKTFNVTETHCTFTILEGSEDFRVSVAARTRAGIGRFSALLSPADMKVHKNDSSWIIEHPWVLGIMGIFVWITLAIVSFIAWRRQKANHYKSVRAVKLEQSLQPPQTPEYAGGQWQVILPANQRYMPPHFLPATPPANTQRPADTLEVAGNVGVQVVPVSLQNTYPNADCYKPLMLDVNNYRPHTNEALYQCGECYEDCNTLQCNHMATPNPQQELPGVALPSCNCPSAAKSKTLDRSSAGVASSSPETSLNHQCQVVPGGKPSSKTQIHPNCSMARYQNAPSQTSPEHLYNELDPRFLSGNSSPNGDLRTTPHHYEVYETDNLQPLIPQSSSSSQGPIPRNQPGVAMPPPPQHSLPSHANMNIPIDSSMVPHHYMAPSHNHKNNNAVPVQTNNNQYPSNANNTIGTIGPNMGTLGANLLTSSTSTSSVPKHPSSQNHQQQQSSPLNGPNGIEQAPSKLGNLAPVLGAGLSNLSGSLPSNNSIPRMACPKMGMSVVRNSNFNAAPSLQLQNTNNSNTPSAAMPLLQ